MPRPHSQPSLYTPLNTSHSKFVLTSCRRSFRLQEEVYSRDLDIYTCLYTYIPIYTSLYIYMCMCICVFVCKWEKENPSWTGAANRPKPRPLLMNRCCQCCSCSACVCLRVCTVYVCVSRVVFVLNWTNFLPVVFYITFCAVFQPPSLPSACCFLTAPLCAFILFVFLYIKKKPKCVHTFTCVRGSTALWVCVCRLRLFCSTLRVKWVKTRARSSANALSKRRAVSLSPFCLSLCVSVPLYASIHACCRVSNLQANTLPSPPITASFKRAYFECM